MNDSDAKCLVVAIVGLMNPAAIDVELSHYQWHLKQQMQGIAVFFSKKKQDIFGFLWAQRFLKSPFMHLERV